MGDLEAPRLEIMGGVNESNRGYGDAKESLCHKPCELNELSA